MPWYIQDGNGHYMAEVVYEGGRAVRQLKSFPSYDRAAHWLRQQQLVRFWQWEWFATSALPPAVRDHPCLDRPA